MCGVSGCIGIVIEIVVGCEAYGGIGTEVVVVVGCGAFGCNCIVVANVVECLWFCFIGGVGGRLMCVGFVVREMRVMPMMLVGQPNTLDETRVFLG